MKKHFIIILINLSIYFAITINIPADHPTIQTGLNEAEEGDTVLVAPGTYYENLIWRQPNGIKLIGSGIETCVVDGDSLSPVLRFPPDLGIIDTNSIVKGFTFQNGYGSLGGGINCSNSSPKIENLSITNNLCSIYGGGIYLSNSNPIIRNVVLTNNNSSNNGGGLYLINSSPFISNSSILDNSTQSDGGGLFVSQGSNPFLNNVIISGNNAINTSSYGGGGIYISNSNPTFFNVIITENSTYGQGGGVNLNNSNPIFDNVSIIGNTAGFKGGGLFLSNSNPIASKIEINENIAPKGGGIYLTQSNPDLDSVSILNNIATGTYHFNGGGGVYCDNGSNPIIKNVIINENQGEKGGGLYCGFNSDLIIINGTFYGNIATGNGFNDGGGGIYCSSGCSPVLKNIVLYGNSARTGGGLMVSYSSSDIVLDKLVFRNNSSNFGGAISLLSSTSVLLNNSVIFGNISNYAIYNNSSNYFSINSIYWNNENGTIFSTGDNEANFYYNIIQDWQSNDENFNFDPLFIDPDTGDFTLQPNSPCIDAGTSFFVYEGDTLINLPDSAYFGSAPDMGAFEFWGIPDIPGCMNPIACNYNEAANVDDGNCTYAEENFDCDGNCNLEIDGCGICAGDGWSCTEIGDVNKDYFIDISDIIIIVEHLLEYNLLEGNAYQNADFNSNGIVNISDVVNIIQIILNN